MGSLRSPANPVSLPPLRGAMDDSHRFIYPDCGQPNFRLLFADHQLSFFSLPRKARNVDYILIAPKGRYHNPRPAGAVKPPNPPAGGPVNLKNLFQIKIPVKLSDFTGIFYFLSIIYVRKYPRAVHRLRFHLPNLSPWPPVWKHPHHGPGRTVSRCQCGGPRDPCYSRHCR